jgi:predicted ribosome quality control (RQC) complex YloA/Tae2 family protein
MHVDALTLRAVRDELARALIDGRIDKIFQPSSTSLALLVRAGGQNHQLFLSAHPESARVHLVTASRLTSGFETPSAFVMVLRKYCEGARVLQIDQPQHERILCIALRQVHGGTARTTSLIIEVMGRRSNLLLIDDVGTVLGLLKRVTPLMSRERPIQVHDSYQPPPAPSITAGDLRGQQKAAPDHVEAPTLQDITSGIEATMALASALIATIAGVSPTLAREVAFRATGNAAAPVTVLHDVRVATSVAEQLHAWFVGEDVVWRPSLAVASGAPTAFAPYILEHLKSPAVVQPLGSISFAIDRYFAARDQTGSIHALRHQLTSQLKGPTAKEAALVAAFQHEIDEAQARLSLRQQGELLLAYQPTTHGQDLVALTGNDGAIVSIPVDPLLDATANAQRIFKRYRKAKTALATLPERLTSSEANLAYLYQAATDVQLAETREELRALEANFKEAGLFGQPDRKPQKKEKQHGRTPKGGAAPKKSTPPSPPLSIIVEGYALLVGRNSRQNEEATFKLAAKGDLWLHARNVPGAHVILRRAGGAPVPDATIGRAAAIAAYYSASRDATSVPVDVTDVGNVRRMRGAKPGMVVYVGETTMRVKPQAV